MSGYLLDTNVISELRKRDRAHSGVRTWVAAQQADDLSISVLALAEIRDGIERLRPRDPRQATSLENWLEETITHFSARILPSHQKSPIVGAGSTWRNHCRILTA